MDKHDQINIATFNCQGFKPRNFEFIKKLFTKCSILLLQEHWLYNFDFKKFLDVLPDCSYHAISSMDETQLTAGRPYGGTGILFKSNLNAVVTPVVTSTPRLCAATFVTDTYKLFLMSVYMPTDQIAHDGEFYDLLNEISAFYNEYENFNFVIGGDFNCDVIRGNRRSEVFIAW